MSKVIEFFWEPGSPYTYLAAQQIDALAREHGSTVAGKPFRRGNVFAERPVQHPGTIPE